MNDNLVIGYKEQNSRYLNSLEIQSRLAKAQNYNDWVFSRIEKYITARVLEVGCALGNFTKKIIDRELVCAVDIEEEYIKAIRDIFKDATNFNAFRCDIASSEVTELKQKEFDTIICLNVLEHIEKDCIALDNMSHLLSKDGYLCLIVPAFQSIFGEMDKTDHHYRRYNKNDIIKKVRMAGFQIVSIKYMNMLGFIGWWFNGKILKRRFIPFRQMLTYDKMIPLFRFIENLFNCPFGQSLVLVAKK